MDQEIPALSESLVDELVAAVGFPRKSIYHKLVWIMFRRITDRLATLGVTFDHLTENAGLPASSELALTYFCTPIAVRGTENIPPEGPLLVVSNHPGAYDGLVIFSKLKRTDICWISSEIPFLEKLPHVRRHIFFASRTDALNRMSVMRTSIRHLQNDGTLVYFGAGHRDPDPAVFPDAGKMITDWLPGIDFFFKHVPGLRLLPCIVSGVISARWARHPITLLRRRQIDKQRLSEFGQVISQLLFPKKLMLSPAISFGSSASASDLCHETSAPSLLSAVISREKELLLDHCHAFGGDPGL
jgi:hypothetical protein